MTWRDAHGVLSYDCFDARKYIVKAIAMTGSYHAKTTIQNASRVDISWEVINISLYIDYLFVWSQFLAQHKMWVNVRYKFIDTLKCNK